MLNLRHGYLIGMRLMNNAAVGLAIIKKPYKPVISVQILTNFL